MYKPLWATPERQAVLEKLKLLYSTGLCSEGKQNCPVVVKFVKIITDKIGLPNEDNPFMWIIRAAMAAPIAQKSMTREELHHLPPWLSIELKEYWKADDRDARSYLDKLNKRRMHALPGIYHRGNYDSIQKSADLAKRPLWHIVTLGVSGFTQGRVAKVFIPGLKATVWVDLKGIKAPSKRQKRRWVRYGKGKAPISLDEQIRDRCSQVVKRYLETPY